MNSVKPNRSAENAMRMAALLEEREQFRAEMADGLHALAQPLTILRSAIAMLAMAQENGAGSKRYVDMSVKQVERTCQFFSSVQELLSARMTTAEQEAIDIRSLLSQAIEERSQTLDELGIRLVVALPEYPCTVSADRQRTEKAISAAFEAAVSASRSGDVIKVDAFSSGEFLELSFESTGKLDNSLKSFDRLKLSVARANILSQQGVYQFTQEPFCILLALPARQHALEDSEHLCYPACAK